MKRAQMAVMPVNGDVSAVSSCFCFVCCQLPDRDEYGRCGRCGSLQTLHESRDILSTGVSSMCAQNNWPLTFAVKFMIFMATVNQAENIMASKC